MRLCFTVNPTGRVDALRVERSSGDDDLDNGALAAVRAAEPLVAPRPVELCKVIEYRLRR